MKIDVNTKKRANKNFYCTQCERYVIPIKSNDFSPAFFILILFGPIGIIVIAALYAHKKATAKNICPNCKIILEKDKDYQEKIMERKKQYASHEGEIIYEKQFSNQKAKNDANLSFIREAQKIIDDMNKIKKTLKHSNHESHDDELDELIQLVDIDESEK